MIRLVINPAQVSGRILFYEKSDATEEMPGWKIIKCILNKPINLF